MADTLKRMKIIIIILSILLGLSLAALAAIIIYGQLWQSSDAAVVTDNYIEPSGGEQTVGANITQLRIGRVSVPSVSLLGKMPIRALSKTVIASDRAYKTVISIYKKHAEDSEPFHLANMFPGDSETNAYLVEVSHRGTVTVRFRADIRVGYAKLSEVLKCKVVLRDENKTLYDGLMRDMPESINHRISSVFSKTTELTYDITVYLDTAVGNEYMNKELVADFRWWVEESGGDPTPPPRPDETVSLDETTETDDTTVPDDTDDPEDTTVPDDTDDSEDTTVSESTTAPEDPDDGELVQSPQTGDNFHFCIWFLIAMFSMLMNIILLRPKHQRNTYEQEAVKANEQ